jgi:hypothetical protein
MNKNGARLFAMPDQPLLTAFDYGVLYYYPQ